MRNGIRKAQCFKAWRQRGASKSRNFEDVRKANNIGFQRKRRLANQSNLNNVRQRPLQFLDHAFPLFAVHPQPDARHREETCAGYEVPEEELEDSDESELADVRVV